MGIKELEKKLRDAGRPLPSNKVNYWAAATGMLHGNKHIEVGAVKYFSSDQSSPGKLAALMRPVAQEAQLRATHAPN